MDERIIGECKSCGIIITNYDDFSYGCPNCESKRLGRYTGIIGSLNKLTLLN